MNQTRPFDEAVARIQSGFDASDQGLEAARICAYALYVEKRTLLHDWATLVRSNDYEEIARRAGRLAEIAKELARIGQ